MPTTSPARVAMVSSPPTTLAIPKSVTFSAPVLENMRFSGLMSRCSTRRPWAAWSPDRQASTTAVAPLAVKPSEVNRLHTVPPGSSSMTSRQSPSCSTKS